MPIAIVMSLAAAAAGLSGPVAKNAQNWIFNSDFSEAEEKKHGAGWVFVKMTVGPDGEPAQCIAEAGSGDDAFRNGICTKLKSRAKFEPARDPSGQPTYGIFEKMVNFTNFGKLPMKPGPDFELQVDKFADPKTFMVDVYVNVGVGKDGSYQGCTVPADIKPADAPYGKIACQQMASLWQPIPEKDMSGQPMSYVRVVLVGFRAPMPKGMTMPGMPGTPPTK